MRRPHLCVVYLLLTIACAFALSLGYIQANAQGNVPIPRTYDDGQGHTVTETSSSESYKEPDGTYTTIEEQYRTFKDNKTGQIVKETHVRVTETYDKKGGKKLTTDTYVDRDEYSYIRGTIIQDKETWDHTTTNHGSGESSNVSGTAYVDEYGDPIDGKQTTSFHVPGQPDKIYREHWCDDCDDWEPDPGSPPMPPLRLKGNMDYVPVEPEAGDGTGVDQGVYFPPIASAGSVIFFTVKDPNKVPNQAGPTEFMIGNVDASGKESFVRSVTEFANHNKYKIAAGIIALLGFREFDDHGNPDIGARCDIGTPGHLAGTQPLLHPPPGPGILEGDSAYEQGGGGQGFIRLHTQGVDPLDTHALLNGSAHSLRTLAVSDESYVGRLDPSVSPGQYTLTLVSDGKKLNSFKFVLVTLQAAPLPTSHPGAENDVTVTVTGIPPGDTAVMDFEVSGAAELAQGGATTTVPVQNGIAQVRIRGIHDGPALIRYHLRVAIPGEWET